MAAFAAGAVILVALVTVVLVTQLGHSGTPTAQGSATPADARSSASAAARKQAAVQLSGLLAKSVKDRSAILTAVHDVDVCGAQLTQDPQVFTRAAASRQKLLTQLTGLAGRSALSSAMLADLTSAWQNSIQADQDLATWARDEASRRCKRYQSNPAEAAAVAPSERATAAKQAFARLWDPMASQYGLPTYQPTQL